MIITVRLSYTRHLIPTNRANAIYAEFPTNLDQTFKLNVEKKAAILIDRTERRKKLRECKVAKKKSQTQWIHAGFACVQLFRDFFYEVEKPYW